MGNYQGPYSIALHLPNPDCRPLALNPTALVFGAFVISRTSQT